MRILPTLCVSGWLVAAVALSSLSAVELLAGGVTQAQQLSPPETSGLNRIQKGPFEPFQSEPGFRWYQGLVGGAEPSNRSADERRAEQPMAEQCQRFSDWLLGRPGCAREPRLEASFSAFIQDPEQSDPRKGRRSPVGRS